MTWATARAAAVSWDPPAVPTLVVVPHPDDESLSTGGLIRRQTARGVPVCVVAVTDGEAAYPGVAGLAATRADEQHRALKALGDNIVAHRLGLEDGGVAMAVGDLTEHLMAIGNDRGIELVVAPWINDHHTDHEACGHAAAVAVRELNVPLAAGMFWTWEHTDPDTAAQAKARGQQMSVIHLSQDEMDARGRAVACHASQVTDILHDPPILLPPDLEPLNWAGEYYWTGGSG